MPYHDLLKSETFFQFLLKVDGDIARYVHDEHCPHCGGALDRGDFLRDAGFGIKDDDKANADCRLRFSFCCRECRKRVTPPSTRFLHGKCFLTVVIVLMATMQQGATKDRQATLATNLGISRQTIDRWRHWWRDVFGASPFWRGWRGRVPGLGPLPGALLDHFGAVLDSAQDTVLAVCALVSCWRWPNPLAIYAVIDGHLSRPRFAQSWCQDQPV